MLIVSYYGDKVAFPSCIWKKTSGFKLLDKKKLWESWKIVMTIFDTV